VHDRAYLIGKKLGLSAKTVAKYLCECRELGILIQQENGEQFIKLSAAGMMLLPSNQRTKYIRFFREFEKTPNFKTYYERIKLAVFKNNVAQQQFRIKQNQLIQSLDANSTQRVKASKYKALLRSRKASSLKELKQGIASSKTVVTSGKYHLGKLIGCCSSTGSRLLKKWAESGMIERTIVLDFHKMPVNEYSLEALRADGNRFVHANKRRTGFYISRGSIIGLPNSPFSRYQK
jgi:hypothetical protein